MIVTVLMLACLFRIALCAEDSPLVQLLHTQSQKLRSFSRSQPLPKRPHGDDAVLRQRQDLVLESNTASQQFGVAPQDLAANSHSHSHRNLLGHWILLTSYTVLKNAAKSLIT